MVPNIQEDNPAECGKSSYPVACALTEIARGAGQDVYDNGQKNWYDSDLEYNTAVFSYSNDFGRLWNWSDPGGLNEVAKQFAKRKEELTLIVVWDGMPEITGDTHRIQENVTPYDWAMALSIALYRLVNENGAGYTLPKLRFLILDIYPSSSNGFAKSNFFVYQHVFPWIKVYRPGANGQSSYFQPVEDLVKVLVNRFPQNAPTLLSDAQISWQHMEPVVQAWERQFLGAGERHNVANWMAPMIMAEALSEDIQEAVQPGAPYRALRSLLKVLGLLKMGKTENGQQQPGAGAAESEAGEAAGSTEQERQKNCLTPVIKEKSGGIFEQRTNVEFLLIDDQYELGFHHIVAAVLFGKEYKPDTSSDNGKAKTQEWKAEVSDAGELRCVDNITYIIKSFNGKDPISNWNYPRRLPLHDTDVLLLDLRLWLKGEVYRRREFLKRIVDLCKTVGAVADNDIKIEDENFNKAYQAALGFCEENGPNSSNAEERELEALALLPLLLSHYDPSYPIIIFSSSQQRTTLKMFEHFPNIITSFSKPVISGYGETIHPEESIKDLCSALEKAIDLHEARVVWERFDEFKVNTQMKYEEVCNGDTEEKECDIDDTGGDVLSNLYCRYILTGSIYDFLSVPYELIDALLYCDSQKIQLGCFQKQQDDTRCNRRLCSPRRGLYNSIKWCRHKKAHGHVTIEYFDYQNWDKRDQIICGLVLFLILIDFLMCSKDDTTTNFDIWNDCSGAIKNNHQSHYWGGAENNHQNLKTALLIKDSVLTAGEFVRLSVAEGACYGWECLNNDTRRYIKNFVTSNRVEV